MALDYDTQIELLFPAALYQDALLGPALAKAGMPCEARSNKVLLFTDPRTVAAMNAVSEPIKAAMRESNIGLVCYGGNRNGGKTDFLFSVLRDIVQKYGARAEPLRHAVMDLHRFVWNGTMGLIDPNPFAGSVCPPPAEPFDLMQALTAMARQAGRPESPEHLPTTQAMPAIRPSFGKRLFGQR